jgi:RNA polymerase-interacting CarD/CdnL/TRCF family regulator
MPDWKQLAAMTPEPSLLDAIAFAEGKMTIHICNGDGFVAHLRTLPDDEAVALVIQAVREGDTRHNQNELFRSRAFAQWMEDMVKSGALMGDDK